LSQRRIASSWFRTRGEAQPGVRLEVDEHVDDPLEQDGYWRINASGFARDA
jgi:hypothetical protein